MQDSEQRLDKSRAPGAKKLVGYNFFHTIWTGHSYLSSNKKYSRSPFDPPCKILLDGQKKVRQCWVGENQIMIFHVTLEQAEDGWIVAEFPALPGCLSQGNDKKEALDNIKEAITAWLWAEDQKAVSGLPKESGRPPVLVAV